MKRRDFLTLAAGAAGAWSVAALAQAKMPTIGVLVIASPGSEKFWQLFEKDMRELGYVEGHSVHFEFRQGPVSGLPELAAELVRLKVDLIVTGATPAAFAAKQATGDISIVMAFAGNPVENGLVVSLARPGGNITGMARLTAELAGKCVELIRDMLLSAHFRRSSAAWRPTVHHDSRGAPTSARGSGDGHRTFPLRCHRHSCRDHCRFRSSRRSDLANERPHQPTRHESKRHRRDHRREVRRDQREA
jgi:hypothetical protein